MLKKILSRFNKFRKIKKIKIDFLVYDKLPDIQITWGFAFIDQIQTNGHTYTALNNFRANPKLRSVVIVNLNKNMKEDALVHVMIHEALHVAINCCLARQFDFVETVIDKWMLGKRTVTYGVCSVVGVEKW